MAENRAKELMLAALGMKNNQARAQQFAEATRVERQEAVRLAVRHGVAPWLYQQLKTMQSQVPDEVLQTLRAEYLGNAVHGRRLYRQLAEILERLAQADIPVIPLKGAYLAERVYGNWALRPMTDLDLLVRKDNVTQAAAILLSIGYSWMGERAAGPSPVAMHHLPPLVRPDCVPLEIHWDLVSHVGPLKQWVDPFTIDLDAVWQRARPAIIAGTSVQALAPEDMLLHLCVHTAYHHKFSVRLSALFDVAEVICHFQDEMDWTLVSQSARQWGVGRSAYLVLGLTKEMLEAPVPPSILETLKPQEFDPRLTVWAKEQILREQHGAPADTLNITRVWRAAGLRGKLVNLLKVVFPSKQMMATLYSRSPRGVGIYLYYLVRVRDLTRQYIHFLCRLLVRARATLAQVEFDEQTNALSDWLAVR